MNHVSSMLRICIENTSLNYAALSLQYKSLRNKVPGVMGLVWVQGAKLHLISYHCFYHVGLDISLFIFATDFMFLSDYWLVSAWIKCCKYYRVTYWTHSQLSLIFMWQNARGPSTQQYIQPENSYSLVIWISLKKALENKSRLVNKSI